MEAETTIYPTVRQERLAQAIAKGDTNTAREMLVNVGYSESVATVKPGEIINSRGVKVALANLGMSEENAAKVVQSIMHNEQAKHSDRLTAADMTFKVQGTYAPIKTESVSLEIDLDALQELRGVADAVATNMRAGETL